jgi:hypothetical protein
VEGAALLADLHHPGAGHDHLGPDQLATALARPDGLAHCVLASHLLYFTLSHVSLLLPAARGSAVGHSLPRVPLRHQTRGKASPDPGKKLRQYSQPSGGLQEKNAFLFDFSDQR